MEGASLIEIRVEYPCSTTTGVSTEQDKNEQCQRHSPNMGRNCHQKHLNLRNEKENHNDLASDKSTSFDIRETQRNLVEDKLAINTTSSSTDNSINRGGFCAEEIPKGASMDFVQIANDSTFQEETLERLQQSSVVISLDDSAAAIDVDRSNGAVNGIVPREIPSTGYLSPPQNVSHIHLSLPSLSLSPDRAAPGHLRIMWLCSTERQTTLTKETTDLNHVVIHLTQRL